MGRVARIRALPAMPPNARWLVELGQEFTVRRYRARPIRTRFVVVDFNPDVCGRGLEAMALFPASEDGEVLDWDELVVSHRGDCIETLEEIIHDLEGLECAATLR